MSGYRAHLWVVAALIGLVILPSLVITPTAVHAAGTASVTTHHNDTARTGANLLETTLTAANVRSTQFGKLFSRTVDGQTYTQPLIVPNLTVGGAAHTVLFVATQHNSVYAFDADGAGGTAPLWKAALEPAAQTSDCAFVLPCGAYGDIKFEVGITGTPVIDTATNTLYVANYWGDRTTTPTT